MEDLMYVYVRCAKNSIILELEQKTIELIKSQHADFEKSIMSYQHNILKMKETFPLDYVMNMPQELR
jgi:hypothetical protein